MFKKAGNTLLVAFAINTTCNAELFVSTGQNGAQVQCDFQHTQHWTYSVTKDVGDIVGGLFAMKRGSQTTAEINFVIFEGQYSSFGVATNMLSVTLQSNAFTQQFSPILFEGAPISLMAGRTYTAVLSSAAPDQQSEAYFIKGGSTTPLVFVDEEGDPWPGDSQITVPAPGVSALIGLAGFFIRRRRNTNE